MHVYIYQHTSLCLLFPFSLPPTHICIYIYMCVCACVCVSLCSAKVLVFFPPGGILLSLLIRDN